MLRYKGLIFPDKRLLLNGVVSVGRRPPAGISAGLCGEVAAGTCGKCTIVAGRAAPPLGGVGSCRTGEAVVAAAAGAVDGKVTLGRSGGGTAGGGVLGRLGTVKSINMGLRAQQHCQLITNYSSLIATQERRGQQTSDGEQSGQHFPECRGNKFAYSLVTATNRKSLLLKSRIVKVTAF